MKKLRLSIRAGLLIAFAGVTAMVVVSAVMGFFVLRSIMGHQSVISEEALPASLTANAFSNSARVLAEFDDRFDRANTQADISALTEEFSVSQDATRQLITELRLFVPDTMLVDTAEALVNEMGSVVTSFIDVSSQRVALTATVRETDATITENANELNRLSEALVSNARSTVTNRISRLYDTIEDPDLIDATYDSIDQVLDVDQPYVARMTDLRTFSLLLRQHALGLINAPDLAGLDAIQTMAEETISSVERSIANIDDPDRRSAAETYLSAIMPLFDKTQAESLHAARVSQLELASGLAAKRTELADVQDRLEKTVSDIVQGSKTEITQAIATARQGAVTGRQTLVSIAVVAVVLSLGIGYFYISQNILRRLNRLRMSTSELANGDLDVDIPPASHDELGQMASALNVFRDGMKTQKRLEQEERQRQEEMRKQEEEARQREAAEQQRRRDEEERQRQLEEKQRLEKEQLQAEQEAERQRFQEQQNIVVNELATGMQCLADGNLTFRIDQEFPESYEKLRLDFNSAMSSLGSLLHGVSEVASVLDVGADEISNAALNLSSRTERSAASLEETAAAVSELSASVQSASEGANQCSEFSSGVKSKAEESRKVVEATVSNMSEIERAGQEIENILKMIDDIAFQTNLLALNAGVEAARAGDAGRGFSVVASEVRELALRAANAAQEINSIIQVSNSKISDGVGLVNAAGDALQEIIGDVAEITTNIQSIASSTQEQAAGILEIDSAVSDQENTVQQNAAMTEETTAASRNMADKAKELQSLIAQFEVPEQIVEETEATRVAS
ncbi:hypothetical protein So717_35990 [Roseobacter cerasinus]|uniref:Methyl-accepting chemotaxis protein n=1 Tax=Roseobacter cerasinus TaxID=2602289 RepID=A0A640W060_9RHOB|nr:methyl-accepting chemotaxis protein [Roseobacter cerasinus]GFE51846.1 hypothetical protein So717_35990 [Roseobacter cerasinus]